MDTVCGLRVNGGDLSRGRLVKLFRTRECDVIGPKRRDAAESEAPNTAIYNSLTHLRERLGGVSQQPHTSVSRNIAPQGKEIVHAEHQLRGLLLNYENRT